MYELGTHLQFSTLLIAPLARVPLGANFCQGQFRKTAGEPTVFICEHCRSKSYFAPFDESLNELQSRRIYF